VTDLDAPLTNDADVLDADYIEVTFGRPGFRPTELLHLSAERSGLTGKRPRVRPVTESRALPDRVFRGTRSRPGR
jgi:hypothetical protein